jgi:hypothetical protein
MQADVFHYHAESYQIMINHDKSYKICPTAMTHQGHNSPWERLLQKNSLLEKIFSKRLK